MSICKNPESIKDIIPKKLNMNKAVSKVIQPFLVYFFLSAEPN